MITVIPNTLNQIIIYNDLLENMQASNRFYFIKPEEYNATASVVPTITAYDKFHLFEFTESATGTAIDNVNLQRYPGEWIVRVETFDTTWQTMTQDLLYCRALSDTLIFYTD